jgi:hypothetical protein
MMDLLATYYSKGTQVITTRKVAVELGVLNTTLEFIRCIDKITSQVNISKKISDQITLADAGKDQKQHPFAGVLSRATRLISNIIADNPSAVRVFEMGPEKLNLIFSKTNLDFDNPTMRENCILCIKYLTDNSENI